MSLILCYRTWEPSEDLEFTWLWLQRRGGWVSAGPYDLAWFVPEDLAHWFVLSVPSARRDPSRDYLV